MTSYKSGSTSNRNSYPHGCPCGYFGDQTRACTCSSSAVTRYQKRISGPLLDRIDIHLEVPRVDYEQLADRRAGEASAEVRARVEAARRVQAERFAGTDVHTNADMGPGEVQQWVRLDAAGEQLMAAAVRQLALSARAYHRVLKLSGRSPTSPGRRGWRQRTSPKRSSIAPATRRCRIADGSRSGEFAAVSAGGVHGRSEACTDTGRIARAETRHFA